MRVIALEIELTRSQGQKTDVEEAVSVSWQRTNADIENDYEYTAFSQLINTYHFLNVYRLLSLLIN